MDEDEIDLIDLFAVLLRYRRVILAIILIAFFGSLGGYFISPPILFEQAQQERFSEGYLHVVAGSVLHTFESEYDISRMFRHAPTVLSALQAAGFQELEYGDGKKVNITDKSQHAHALFMVQQRLIRNQSPDGENLGEEKRLYTIKDHKNGLEISFKSEDTERIKNFMNELYKQANSTLTRSLQPQAEATIVSYEQLLAQDNPDEALQNTLATDRREYLQAKQLSEGRVPVILKEGEVYVVKPEFSIETFQNKYKLMAVVLSLAAIFFSVFLAFVLNAVSNIRSNSESMEKIREALKK